jgi:hypothetical protein
MRCPRTTDDRFIELEQGTESWGTPGPLLTISAACTATLSDESHKLMRVVDASICERLRELVECQPVLDRIGECRMFDYNEPVRVTFAGGRVFHGDTACSEAYGFDRPLDVELHELLVAVRRSFAK